MYHQIDNRYREVAMKASMKLRLEEGKSPLLRAKLPVSVLGLPLISAAAVAHGDEPKDLYFHLRTVLSTGPSLKLSYHPNLSAHAFSLSLTSGVGPLGSPTCSPLLFSAHVSFSPSIGPSPISFSIRFAPQFGDFTFRKTAVFSARPNPNYIPKENGVGIHRPIPFVRGNDRTSVESPGLELSARTTMRVFRRAEANFRWAVNFPPAERFGLPYLTFNKISFESVEVEDLKEVREKVETKKAEKEWGEKGNMEALKGVCACIRKEVDELQRMNRMIRESIGAVNSQVFEERGNSGATPGRSRRNVCAKDATSVIRPSTGAATN